MIWDILFDDQHFFCWNIYYKNPILQRRYQDYTSIPGVLIIEAMQAVSENNKIYTVKTSYDIEVKV